MERVAKIFLNVIADAVFPRFCVRCNHEGVLLCASCKADWNPTPPKLACYLCEKPSAFGFTCSGCASEDTPESLISGFYYADPVVNRLLRIWKYHFDQTAQDLLLKAADRDSNSLDQAIAFIQPDVIAHIPLHRRKLCERGFDQAEVIAEVLSEHYGIQRARLLSRIRYTDPQAERSIGERKMQMTENPFSAIGAHVPESILLVDDVWTTGATALAAVRELKHAGAKRVCVYTLARR